jgi:hypothetical protein
MRRLSYSRYASPSLFKLLSLLGLFFWACASSSLKTQKPTSHPLDAHELLDMYAFMSRDIIIPNAEDFYFPVGTIGQSISCDNCSLLDVCLCTSSLPLFIQINLVTVVADRALGDTLAHIWPCHCRQRHRPSPVPRHRPQRCLSRFAGTVARSERRSGWLFAAASRTRLATPNSRF